MLLTSFTTEYQNKPCPMKPSSRQESRYYGFIGHGLFLTRELRTKGMLGYLEKTFTQEFSLLIWFHITTRIKLLSFNFRHVN
jgi:hypothetical protein